MSTIEKTRDIEHSLTEDKAKTVSDQSYLGEANEAEIFDVRTEEDVDSGTVVEFDIWLPNSKKGIISFSQRDLERGHVDKFLDNINCTVNNLDDLYCESDHNALHQSVPVTYKKYNGWIVLYGPEKHLDSTYTGESNWYCIDPETAHPHPNARYAHLMNLPFYIGIIISIYNWSIIPAFLGFIALGAIWYMNCMAVGFSMPHRKSIETE